ncbi:MAG: FG-GAP-like repeat-containing protein [Candidatus Azobacteroides sp.]|nr:FG-GAP-like repeat-containing protein [Candidatus Azobacteroides sp.]
MKRKLSFIRGKDSVCTLVYIAVFLFFVLPAGAQTRVPLKANIDNVYVTPGGYAILDVLRNDEFGDCNRNTIKLSIVQYPSHGTVIPIPATGNIYYIPNAGFTGQDRFRYQIECAAGSIREVSDTIVNVSVFNQPSNMITDVCYVPRPPMTWDIEMKAISDVPVHPLATPFVGDLDGDGNLEVVVPGSHGYSNYSDSIIVLDHELKLKNKFKVPQMPTYPTMPLLIADVDNDGQGEIVIFTNYNNGEEDTYRLQCYTGDGVLKWTSSVPVFTASQLTNPTAPNSDISLSLIIADIDGDGKSEILAWDKIFAAENGRLLATLPDGGRAWRGINGATRFPNPPIQAAMPAFADIDNDGKLEVLAGNTTYRVTITDRNSDANEATVIASVPQEDGFVSVADIDGDGYLDVVVTTHDYFNLSNRSKFYVYSGLTGAMIGSPVFVDGGISRAFVGDIDGDGSPDIAFTCGYSMYAFRYDKAADSFVMMWQGTTSDASGCTTMSMFDFDQNGEAELVYRDETKLRILNKNGIDVLPNGGIDCLSATHTEYPIVVDFDKDGHADILVSGAMPGANRNTDTRIMWFGSQTPGQWAPCRSVWNQHGFNPAYIDENLLPVRYPVNPAAAFYENGTGIINHPFNNFLQQTTTLNEAGTPLFMGPDLYFDSGIEKKIFIDNVNNKLIITIGINNAGNASYTGNLHISTYVYNSSPGATTEYHIGSNDMDVDIPVNTPTTIVYEISGYPGIMPPKYDYWEIRLNWEGNTYPMDMAECVYYNNIANNLSLTQGEHVMCQSNPADPSDTERVYIYPANTYWYKWYNDPVSSASSNLVGEGDYYDVHKDASPVQKYYVEIWDLATKSEQVGTMRDTVFVYLAPDSLIWTGFAKNQDWHDYENWLNPADLSGNLSRSNVPRKCTDVLIPDMISNYPDLTPETLGGHTVYDQYKRSECANIWFEHGGEVMRTDSLDYDAAYVWLTLNSNRWYMVSAPLQSLFPGDYYISDPRPCEDDVFMYTRLWNKENPQTGDYVAGNWTGVFNNPDYPMPAGSGFSVWVDDKQPDATVHTPKSFLFPKHEDSYGMYAYFGGSNCIYQYSVPLPRVNENRFVYEPGRNVSTGSVRLDVSADAAGTQVIVGNPFMAHWDFNQFQALNDGLIEPFYQVLDENGTFISYDVAGGSTTGELQQYIAPMQSVLVTSKTPFSALYTNAVMTTTVPGDKLRSGGEMPAPEVLSVKVSNAGISNKTLLYYHPEGLPEGYTDVPKTFLNDVTGPVTVYTVSESGKLSDMLHVDDLSEPLFLGIRTSDTGEFEFRMDGIRLFAPDYDIFLTDLGLPVPTQINLRVFPYYTFNKTTSDLFVNDRFYLSFVKSSTDIRTREAEPTTGIEILNLDGGIRVLSVDGSLLKDVGIYDLQGKPVHIGKNIQAVQTGYQVSQPGIYIVRATNGNISKAVKIYCR